MTFAQLRAFALVAELGSLRAAAAALGVSEPAVSAAIAALKADLGDPLFVRTGSGIALTPGGRALAGHARELVRMAERARREVTRAAARDGVRAAATPVFAEQVGPLLVAAYARRVPGTPVRIRLGSVDGVAATLADDDADIALGVRPVPVPGQDLNAVPFLRYRRILVTAPGSPPARRRPGPLPAFPGEPWLTGPAGLEAGSEEHRWVRLAGVVPDVVAHDSEAAALAAVRAGTGVMLALEHVVRDELRRGRLVRLPVEGTPVSGMWWASVPAGGRATPAARLLQRFLTTPDATTALLARRPLTDRLRPTVRVELWS